MLNFMQAQTWKIHRLGLTTQEPIHSPIKVCPPTIQRFLGAGAIVG